MSRSLAAAEAGPPHVVQANIDLEATVACPRCGLAAAWGALVPMSVLEGAALESLLAVPPDGWLVEVRSCTRCRGSLARKMRVRRVSG